MSRRKRRGLHRPAGAGAAAPAARTAAPKSATPTAAAPARRPDQDAAPTPAERGAGAPTARRWVAWFLLAASYAGFVVSLYLTFVHYRGYVSPCYVVHGCETVQTSRYSVVLGVPVALVGTLYFGLLFYLGVGLLTRRNVVLVRLYKVLAFLGALAVIPLFLLQAVVLKAFCSYCVTTEVLMLAIWIGSFPLTAAEDRARATDGRPAPVS